MDVFGTVTASGQIAVPASVRDTLGLTPGDNVLIRVLDGRAVVWKVPNFLDLAGSVPVPVERRGAEWASIRAATWRTRARGMAGR